MHNMPVICHDHRLGIASHPLQSAHGHGTDRRMRNIAQFSVSHAGAVIDVRSAGGGTSMTEMCLRAGGGT
jgi:hypothetical protein